MQQQLCPRCKFRLTVAKAICPTCGYSLQTARKPHEMSESPAPAKVQQVQKQVQTQASSLRKAQAAPQGAGSFWRAFFGLDPLPPEKSDRDEPALGET